MGTMGLPPIASILVLMINGFHMFTHVNGFVPSAKTLSCQNTYSTQLFSHNNKEQKKGYKFGDITKSLIGSRVEKITGKPYEFGDLSRKIDSTIKESINSLTGNDDYEFGDLSRYVDSQVKQQVNKFTKKERYHFGDLTRELLKRVADGEYTLDDLFMLLKALAVFEASISPVAGFLPVKLLVELLNFSLVNDVAGRVSSALAMELDRRLKKSILGDENYVLGDATKKTIANAVGAFTGKESYTFGDVTKKVVSNIKSNQQNAVKNNEPLLLGTASINEKMDRSIGEATETWDKALMEKGELKERREKLDKYVQLIEKGE